VVVLWPYVWKVIGSNLVRGEIGRNYGKREDMLCILMVRVRVLGNCMVKIG